MCHDRRDDRRDRFDHREHRDEDFCCHYHEPWSRCDCGCQDDRRFGLRRHFFSKAEMIEALEAYLKELENEAQGVREAIAELKSQA